MRLQREEEIVVEGHGNPETVNLTRRRGDAEFRHEKRKEQNERRDSGGCW